MSKTRTWVLGAIAAMLVVIVGGWTLGISPVYAQITTTTSQLSTAQSSGQASQVQLTRLRTQYKDIAKLKKKLKALRYSIPETQSASLFLDEIAVASYVTGVQLQNVTIASATLYASPMAAPPAAAATTTTSAPSATPAPGAATAPAPATTTASGLILIPVVITVKGNFEQTREFADAMQTGPRLFVTSGLSSVTDGVTTATITGTIFSIPGTSDAPKKSTATGDGISTATPTPTATATLTPTPTPTPTKGATTTTSGSSGTSNTAPTPSSTPTPVETPVGP